MTSHKSRDAAHLGDPERDGGESGAGEEAPEAALQDQARERRKPRLWAQFCACAHPESGVHQASECGEYRDSGGGQTDLSWRGWARATEAAS